jgi:hypothetical protein
LIVHIRELYVALLEELLLAEPDVEPKIRQMATALGRGIDRLQATVQVQRGES